jgi:hypothetical protein
LREGDLFSRKEDRYEVVDERGVLLSHPCVKRASASTILALSLVVASVPENHARMGSQCDSITKRPQKATLTFPGYHPIWGNMAEKSIEGMHGEEIAT